MVQKCEIFRDLCPVKKLSVIGRVTWLKATFFGEKPKMKLKRRELQVRPFCNTL